MEFKDTEELKEYILKRALKRTKFKLTLFSMRTKNKETSNETLNELYKASLKEVRKEIDEELRNGTITVLNVKTKRKTK